MQVNSLPPQSPPFWSVCRLTGMYGPPPFRKRKMRVTGWSAQMYSAFVGVLAPGQDGMRCARLSISYAVSKDFFRFRVWRASGSTVVPSHDSPASYLPPLVVPAVCGRSLAIHFTRATICCRRSWRETRNGSLPARGRQRSHSVKRKNERNFGLYLSGAPSSCWQN